MSDPYEAYPETRFTRFPPEVRRGRYDETGPKLIYGYAAAFGKLSRKLGGWVEQVAPTAFNDCKAEGWPDVTATFDRQPRVLLGTAYARTLKLVTDDTGLAYEVEPPEHLGYVTEYVERGDIRHSQFTYVVEPDGGDEWGMSEYAFPMRTLLRVQLVSIGPVLNPAYENEDGARKAMAGAVASLARAVHADPDEVRERLAEGKAAEFFRRAAQTDGGSKPS